MAEEIMTKIMCISEETVKSIVQKEMQVLEADFRSARNWTFAVLVGLIGSVFAVGVWTGAISNKVETLDEQHSRFENKIEGKLERIENLLLEITKEISNK